MGVPTDKDIWGIGFDLFPYGNAITAGNTTNMCHPEIEAFFGKPLMQWIHIFNLRTVDITINADNGCNALERFCDFRFPEVTCVPNLIPVRKVFFYLGIEVVMCVGY